MNDNQIDLNILRQIADETCTISFEAWRQVRAKGYVESEVENTPDGVYAKLSERGAKLLRQANTKATMQSKQLTEMNDYIKSLEFLSQQNEALRQQLKAIESICTPIIERGWRTPISELSSLRLARRIHEAMAAITQEVQNKEQ